MKKLIALLKALLGIALGLLFSFLTIVGLDALLVDPNPFGKKSLNLWLVSPIIAFWLLLMLWLTLRKWSGEKIHTQGIELLPPTASEWIDAIIEAMGYRKSARADVRQELTDHFTDALHGCQNDLERQKCAEELIAEFGDVKLLGKLIRRGKKRCRSFRQTLVVRAFQGIGILFLLLALYIAWFFSGKPIITTNYVEVMNKKVRPVADDSFNAAPFYEQAAKLYAGPGKLQQELSPEFAEGVGGMEDAFDMSPRSYAKLSEQEKKVLADWLAANQQAMELVRQGNTKPYCWRTYGTEGQTTELIAILLPNLNETKRLGQLLCWQGIVEAQEGRFRDAFDSVLECYDLGRHIHNKTILIEQLVAIAIQTVSTNTMRLLLDENAQAMDSAMLSGVRSRFMSPVADADFVTGFEGERMFFHDEIQRCFTQSRIGKSHLYLQRVHQLGIMNSDPRGSTTQPFSTTQLFQFLFTHPDKQETLAAGDRFYDAMEQYARYAPAQLRKEKIDLTKQIEQVVKGNVLLKLMLPALEKIIHLSFRNKADSEATLAVLAILEYQKQKGSLPQSLDELVKTQLLPTVPIDPYSDQALVYKKTAGGFTLYSIGPNFKDDGGVLPEFEGGNRLWQEDKGEPDAPKSGGDAVFWPVQ